MLLLIAGFFGYGLTRDPHKLPSLLIDRPMPDFELQQLSDDHPLLVRSDLHGRVALVNVFGSWCSSCVAEHPMLMDLTRSGAIDIFGVDWRDTPEAGSAWLARFGDPYLKVGVDADSKLAVDLGVTGAPESFLVDKEGRIRYKHIGPITREVWEEILQPMAQRLQAGDL